MDRTSILKFKFPTMPWEWEQSSGSLKIQPSKHGWTQHRHKHWWALPSKQIFCFGGCSRYSQYPTLGLIRLPVSALNSALKLQWANQEWSSIFNGLPENFCRVGWMLAWFWITRQFLSLLITLPEFLNETSWSLIKLWWVVQMSLLD